jgi:hypothetical protein
MFVLVAFRVRARGTWQQIVQAARSEDEFIERVVHTIGKW